ncbi:hypothetical protein [Streptomyces sp. MI02-7b]|uniref:hypothetical protein n=1 Tax=Streptomyces sp. MI02-7b TaxID=462941 RepID=UPI0029A85CCB|nr:hypothetical protein [Streptomyces sp. MI02-7b]MDX3074594.1 hypothetical protein [Streptomyces sp. MI02-7b]
MTREPRGTGAADSRCPSCGAPVLRQLVGRIAALTVTADPTPLTPEQETQVRTDPNRLTWCLITGRWRPPELRWRHPAHSPHCTHHVVACHRCPPAAPTTLF